MLSRLALSGHRAGSLTVAFFAIAALVAAIAAPTALAMPARDARATALVAADAQPPSVPSGMAWGTKTATSIAVRWNASTDNTSCLLYTSPSPRDRS